MDRFVVISGCSGGGKSALLAELARAGHAVVPEPGRRIVAAELAHGGRALPWIDPVLFARRAVRLSLADRAAAGSLAGTVFFDRGLVDALAALEHLTGRPWLRRLGPRHRFHAKVFLTPPWPELFTRDDARRHGFAAAAAEHARLERAWPALGYDPVVLPRASVGERVDLVLARLAAGEQQLEIEPQLA